MSTTVAAHRAAERWFLDRGLPSVLTPRARLQAVWSRSAPFLAFSATLDVCSAVTYQMTGGFEWFDAPALVQRIGLAVALLTLPVAAGVGWIVARMVTDRAQAIVSAVAVAIGIASGTVKGHTSQQHLAHLAEGIVTVPVVLLLTAAGVGSVIGWAVRLALTQFVAAWALLVRALPVVLLSVLVFFNDAVWTMAATLSLARFVFGVSIFGVVAAAFVVEGTIEHAKPALIAATASSRHAPHLAGTPFEDMPDPVEVQPLTRGERFNVVFTLAASQFARILTVAVVAQTLFFVVGLVLATPELLGEWTHHSSLTHGTLLGYPIPVPQALIHMTLFLGALTFMYVSARSVGDGEYRHQFLDPLIEDLKHTLLARNRYLNNPSGRKDADQEPATNSNAPYPVDQVAECELDNR
jgi:hypothetical protein